MALPFRAQFSFKIPATLSDFSSIQINRPAKVPRYDEAESLGVSRRRRRISLGQDSKRSGLGNGWTASSDIGIPSIKSYDVDGTRIPQVCPMAWEMVAICGVWKGIMDSTEARILYSIEQEYCKVLCDLLEQCVLDHRLRRPKNGPINSEHPLVEMPLDWGIMVPLIATHLESTPGSAILGPKLKPLIEVYLLSTSNIACTNLDKSANVLLRQRKDCHSIIMGLDWLDFPDSPTRWLTEGTRATIRPVYCSQMDFVLKKYSYSISFQVCGPFCCLAQLGSLKRSFCRLGSMFLVHHV